MRISIAILAVLLAICVQDAHAFVKGSAATRTSPQLSSSTELYAAAKKKKAAKKKAASDVETLKKADFVKEVAERLDTTKVGGEAAVNAVLSTIADNVADGKKITLPGFGTFQLRFRNARKGRNPQTGEELDIKASFSPGFTAAKAFKEKANP